MKLPDRSEDERCAPASPAATPRKGGTATYTAYVYRGHDQSEQPLTIYNVVGFQTAPYGVSITCERHDDAGDHEATYSIKHSGFARIILAHAPRTATPDPPAVPEEER